MNCTNCGSTELRWYVATAGPNDVTDGRIRMSEVRAIAYLACEECSETLSVVQEDEISTMLNSKIEEERLAEGVRQRFDRFKEALFFRKSNQPEYTI